jgi:hypothetical protein
MRKNAVLSCFLALSVLLPLSAGSQTNTVNAYYSFADFTTHPLNVSRVIVTPLAQGADYAGTQLSPMPLFYSRAAYPCLTNGAITVSNLVCGYAYAVACSDGYGLPTITNYFPASLTNDLSGTVSGNTWKTTSLYLNHGVVQGYALSSLSGFNFATNWLTVSNWVNITNNVGGGTNLTATGTTSTVPTVVGMVIQVPTNYDVPGSIIDAGRLAGTLNIGGIGNIIGDLSAGTGYFGSNVVGAVPLATSALSAPAYTPTNTYERGTNSVTTNLTALVSSTVTGSGYTPTNTYERGTNSVTTNMTALVITERAALNASNLLQAAAIFTNGMSGTNFTLTTAGNLTNDITTTSNAAVQAGGTLGTNAAVSQGGSSTNFTLTTAGNLTNDITTSSNAAVQAAGTLGTNAAVSQGGSSTNFTLTTAGNLTNDITTSSNAAVQAAGTLGTNAAIAQSTLSTNFTRNTGNDLTNFVNSNPASLNATNFTRATGTDATNHDLATGLGGTNFTLLTAGNLTNDIASSSNAAVQAAGTLGTNAAVAQSMLGTNFTLLTAGNLTNDIASSSNAAVQAAGTLGTNAAVTQSTLGTNFTRNTGTDATNFTQAAGLSFTNLIGTNGISATNFSLSVSNYAATNISALAGSVSSTAASVAGTAASVAGTVASAIINNNSNNYYGTFTGIVYSVGMTNLVASNGIFSTNFTLATAGNLTNDIATSSNAAVQAGGTLGTNAATTQNAAALLREAAFPQATNGNLLNVTLSGGITLGAAPLFATNASYIGVSGVGWGSYSLIASGVWTNLAQSGWSINMSGSTALLENNLATISTLVNGPVGTYVNGTIAWLGGNWQDSGTHHIGFTDDTNLTSQWRADLAAQSNFFNTFPYGNAATAATATYAATAGTAATATTALAVTNDGLQGLVFGQEYLLGAWYSNLLAGKTIVVDFSGDSTTAGSYTTTGFDVATLFAKTLTYANATIYNDGCASASTAQWCTNGTTPTLSNSVARAPTLMFLRWGMNDSPNGVQTFSNNLSLGLAYIRSNLPISVCSIVLETPNSATATNVATLTPAWGIAINQTVRSLARQYGCAFLDIFNLTRDSGTNANSWLDGYHVHPVDSENVLINSEHMRLVYPRTVADIVENNFFNGLQFAPNVTNLPTTYPIGPSEHYGYVSQGWPNEGGVFTFRQHGGGIFQINSSYNTPVMAMRTGSESPAAWNNYWRYLPNMTANNYLTLSGSGSDSVSSSIPGIAFGTTITVEPSAAGYLNFWYYDSGFILTAQMRSTGWNFGVPIYGDGRGLTNVTAIAGWPTNGVVPQVKPAFYTNYIPTTNDTVLLCSGTNQVINLSNAVSVTGKFISVYPVTSTASVIVTNTAKTVMGATSQTVTNGQHVTVISDGSNWW